MYMGLRVMMEAYPTYECSDWCSVWCVCLWSVLVMECASACTPFSPSPTAPCIGPVLFLCVSTLFISLFTKYTSVRFMLLLHKAQSNPKGFIEVHEVIHHRTEFCLKQINIACVFCIYMCACIVSHYKLAMATTISRSFTPPLPLNHSVTNFHILVIVIFWYFVLVYVYSACTL